MGQEAWIAGVGAKLGAKDIEHILAKSLKNCV